MAKTGGFLLSTAQVCSSGSKVRDKFTSSSRTKSGLRCQCGPRPLSTTFEHSRRRGSYDRFRPIADVPLLPHNDPVHLLVITLLIAAPPFANLNDAFGRCLEGERAQSGEFPAILDCYTAAYRKEDRRLNAVYRSALSRLSTARRRQTVNDQRRWIQARDERCRGVAIADGAIGTQDGRLAELSCLTLETAKQADRLLRLG